MRRLMIAAAGLAAALAVGQMAAVGRAPGQPGDPKADPAPGHGQRARDFVAAFNRGDAKAVAGFWAPDGDYVDPAGREYKGRAAIEKLYEKFFAGHKGAKLAVTVTSARAVGPDTAIEDGVTEVTPADGGPGAAARFSAVLVRKDGEWSFASVRESAAVPPSHAEHLDDLAWLIGEWAGEEKGESGRATFDWAENQNFIVSSYATTVDGVPVAGGTQWIGWDPVARHVRSWTFYSGGGFGEAAWTMDGNRWALKTTATSADGRKITATNVITKVDADTATWQQTDLAVDGRAVPAPRPLKLKRVKADRP